MRIDINNILNVIANIVAEGEVAQLKVGGTIDGNFFAEITSDDLLPLFDNSGEKELRCECEDSLEDALFLLNQRCA